MRDRTNLLLALFIHVFFCFPTLLFAADLQADAQRHLTPTTALWRASDAEHIYGFPDIKHNKKGSLTLSGDSLTFTSPSGEVSIPRSSVTAVSAGNQRVEIWGIGGRLLRMTIPDGGGLAAAAVMQHRIDMLTVEYRDTRGAGHGAVFFLPSTEAEGALRSFAIAPATARKPTADACHTTSIDPRSVVVMAPNWDHATVPAAYRALVYEHLIDHLRETKGIGRVYRDGEGYGPDGCPQYTIHIAISGFKEGSSVQRAFMGPVGMFVGTTEMRFDVDFHDAAGGLNIREQVKATMRGESESTNVADHVAKSLTKRYAVALENAAKNKTGKGTNHPAS